MDAGNSIVTFKGELIGLDIIGFTRAFDRQLKERGPGCLEELTDSINAGFSAALAPLARHGFRVGDILGDCIIFYREADAIAALANGARPPLEQLVIDALDAFIRGAGVFSARAGFATGHAVFYRIKGPDGLTHNLLSGEAVEELHEVLGSADPRVVVRHNKIGDAANGYRPASASAALAQRKAGAAELRDAVVVFCRLCGGATLPRLPIKAIPDAVELLINASADIGGVFEKITHDDKGVIAAIAFRDVSAQGIARAGEFPSQVVDSLRQIGLKPSFGVAKGRIYYGPLVIDDEVFKTIHGPAVNAAAKRLVGSASTVSYDESMQADREAGAAAAGLGAVTTAPDGGGLIGRRDELAATLSHAEAAAAQDSYAVIVQGEAGIGKTHFCEHVAARLSGRFAVLRAAARPDSSIVPLSMSSPLLTAALGRLAALEERDRQASIDQCIARRFNGTGDQIRSVCNLHFGTDFPVDADGAIMKGEQRRRLLVDFAAALFRELAAHGPIAIVVDDLQWADAISVQLIERLIHDVTGLFCLFGNRTSTTKGHADLLLRLGEDKCRSIQLPGLERHEIDELAGNKLSALGSDGKDHRDLLGLTGGNPYYAIQLFNALAEEPGLKPSDLIRPGKTSQRDDVMAAIVASRLDRLSERETFILRIAALMADPISNADHQAIAARLKFDIGDADALLSLAARDFLKAEAGGAAPSFRMAHGLLTDQVIERMTPFVIKDLSAHAARFNSARRRIDPASVSWISIANHWIGAQSFGRAAILLEAEAEAAIDVGAYANAIKLFEQALEHAGKKSRSRRGCSRRRSAWHALSARARWAMGDIKAAREDVDAAFRLADRWAFGAARTNEGPPHGAAGSFGVTWALRLKLKPRLAQRLMLPVNLANALRGELAYYRGDLRDIVRSNVISFMFAREPAQRAGVVARNFAMLGYFTGMARLTAASRRVYAYAGQRLDMSSDKRPMAFVEASEAVVNLAFGRWPRADRLLAKAREHAFLPYEPHIFEVAETLQALSAQFQGDWTAARDIFADLEQQALSRGNRLHEAWGCYGQAQACLIGGEIAKADDLLRRAEPMVAQLGDRQSQLICHGLRAQIHLAQGGIGQALQAASQALDFGRSMPPFNFSSLEGYAAPAFVGTRLLFLPGLQAEHRKRALELARKGVPHLEKFARVFPIGRPRALLCRALLCRSMNRGRRARALLSKARQTAGTLGMRYELDLIEQFGSYIETGR